jgi:hypothetical protein
MPMSHRVRLQARNGRLRGYPQGLPAMLRGVFLRVIPFLLLIASAQAQSAASAVQDFGLFGTWAVECSQPPSPTNEHAVVSLAPVDTIWVLNDFGPDYEDMVYRVVDAKRVGPDKLSLRQVLASDEAVVLDIVMVKDSERVRVWSSRTAQGSILVKDGRIATTTDQNTRWSKRCGERWASQPDSAIK